MPAFALAGKVRQGGWVLKKPAGRPWFVLLFAVIIAATAGASPLATASAEPVNDSRVTPGCHGQDHFDSSLVAFATGIVVNKGMQDCTLHWLAYNTYDCAPISACGQGQDLVGVAGPVVLKPGTSLTISVSVPSNVCKVQFDPVIGWIGAPLQHLAGGAEYGTNMLAGGKGFTATNPNCMKPTPTPTVPPPTPTIVLTPSPTATPTTVEPTPTPTKTKTPTATPTGTLSPTTTPSATPTGTQVPPTASPTVAPTEAPTQAPTVVQPTPTQPVPAGTPAPRPPSAGTGMLVSQTQAWALTFMVFGAIIGAYVLALGHKKASKS